MRLPPPISSTAEAESPAKQAGASEAADKDKTTAAGEAKDAKVDCSCQALSWSCLMLSYAVARESWLNLQHNVSSARHELKAPVMSSNPILCWHLFVFCSNQKLAAYYTSSRIGGENSAFAYITVVLQHAIPGSQCLAPRWGLASRCLHPISNYTHCAFIPNVAKRHHLSCHTAGC